VYPRPTAMPAVPSPLYHIKGRAQPPIRPAALPCSSFLSLASQRCRTEEAKPELRHRPDLLLRRVFLLSKPLGKVPVSSYLFWYSPRVKWWLGGHLWLTSGQPSLGAGRATPCATVLPPPAVLQPPPSARY
jgi:hypothetical protein